MLDDQFSHDLKEKLIGLRQDLHRYPELSFKEEKTSARLFAELSNLNPADVKKVAGTGIVARFKGRSSGAPTIAIRGDIDALPIHEKTGLSYASQRDGIMHACGHDVHATWTIGAAALLSEKPAAGDVLIILQPAEEIAQGALAILETGVLDDVAVIFGAHVDRRFEVGQVVAQEGPLAASSDMFEVDFFGKGAHGARPHESSDPIVAAASFITSVQTIVSRRLNPATPGVITVGSFHAGVAANVIPEKAMLSGTIRATDPESRDFIKNSLRELARLQAEAMGVRAEFRVHSGTPPIINLEKPTQLARQAVLDFLGADALVPLDYVNMGGEDFAWYMEKIPGCFLRIGAREKGGQMIAAHSPEFYAHEECIFVGAAILAEAARLAARTV